MSATQHAAWPAESPLDLSAEWARIGDVLGLVAAGLPAAAAAHWVQLRQLAALRLAPVVATQAELARRFGLGERTVRVYHEQLARVGLLLVTRRGQGAANLVPVCTAVGVEVAQRALAAGALTAAPGEVSLDELRHQVLHEISVDAPRMTLGQDVDPLVVMLAGYQAAAAAVGARQGVLEVDGAAVGHAAAPSDEGEDPETPAETCRSAPRTPPPGGRSEPPDRQDAAGQRPAAAADERTERQNPAGQRPDDGATRDTERQVSAGLRPDGFDCRDTNRQDSADRAPAAARSRACARGGGFVSGSTTHHHTRATSAAAPAVGGRARDEAEVDARVAECGQFAADVRRALDRHLPYERAGHTKAWDRGAVARARLELAAFVRDRVRDGTPTRVLAEALGALLDRTLDHPHAARVWLRTAIARRGGGPPTGGAPSTHERAAEQTLVDAAADAEARARAAADAERDLQRRVVRELLATDALAPQLELAVQRRLGADRVTVDAGRARPAVAHDYDTRAAIAEARTALVDALAAHLADGALTPAGLALLAPPDA